LVKNFQNSEFWTIKARVMEINLEKKVGFQKLRQDEIEFLQVQKRENSRIMIFVVLMFCLTIIGILAAIFYMDQKEIAIENTPEPMNNSIIIESDVQFRAWNLSNEDYVYEEKTLQEHIELLEKVNKTVCSNSSHPYYDICEDTQESLLDYQKKKSLLDSGTISNDG